MFTLLLLALFLVPSTFSGVQVLSKEEEEAVVRLGTETVLRVLLLLLLLVIILRV